MMTRLPLLSVAAVLVAGAVGYWYFGTGTQEAETNPNRVLAIPGADSPEDAESALQTSSIVDMAIGSADAPLEIIEYASFTCPHCRTFHKTTFEEIKETYVDTGQVRFIHREVYFDRYGLWAGMVARCGGEERYFGIADIIYDEQADWLQGEPTDIVEALRRIGRTAGLTNEQLDACLSDGEKAQTLVAWYQENSEAHGINSTPSFVIDGQTYSNMPFAEFSEIIDGKIGG